MYRFLLTGEAAAESMSGSSAVVVQAIAAALYLTERAQMDVACPAGGTEVPVELGGDGSFNVVVVDAGDGGRVRVWTETPGAGNTPMIADPLLVLVNQGDAQPVLVLATEDSSTDPVTARVFVGRKAA